MYGNNWLQKLQKRKAKFVLTADLDQQKKEVFDLVLKDPSAFEFDLTMAKAAFQQSNCHYNPIVSLFVPAPTLYLSSVDANDIDNFFKRLNDIGTFASDLIALAINLTSRKRVKDDEAHLVDLVQDGGDPDKFFQLLHFMLFTNPHQLKEMDTPWYNEIPCQKVQVLHCCYSIEEETRFAKKGQYHALLFHGTHESNIYSIMRNGISRGYNGAVCMSNDINISLAYARSVNKVFLVFEAREKYSLKSALIHFCFQPFKLMLRAIIWVAADSVGQVQTVASKAVTEIKKKCRDKKW